MENGLNFSYISAIQSKSVFEGLENLESDSNDTAKLFCTRCLKTPIIYLKNLSNLNLTCDCDNNKNNYGKFNIKEVNENFIIDLEDSFDDSYEEYEKYFKCDMHGNKIFQFFCNNCAINLCKECVKRHNCSENMDIIDFNLIHFQISKNIIFIDNAFKKDFFFLENDLEEVNGINNSTNNNIITNKDNINYLKRLISTMIYEYNTTSNMEIIKYINNIHDKLSRDYNLYIKNMDMNVNIEIYSEYEYYKKISDANKEFVKEIEIFEYNFNINILKNAIFINLEILNLKGNNNSDISVLASVKFENLKILNLFSNQIGDDMIEYIYKFDFPELTSLDIGLNNFHNYEFFKSIEHFEKLKELKVKSNPFNKVISQEKNIREIKLYSLEEVDFSNGIFSDEIIYPMFKLFKFQNLKSIDLTCNGLKKLSFLENIKNCPLEILILAGNEIDESQLIILRNFPNLKEINLKNNEIKSKNELNDLVNILKNLEKIIVYRNKINLYLNEEKEENIIDEIDEAFEIYF